MLQEMMPDGVHTGWQNLVRGCCFRRTGVMAKETLDPHRRLEGQV